MYTKYANMQNMPNLSMVQTNRPNSINFLYFCILCIFFAYLRPWGAPGASTGQGLKNAKNAKNARTLFVVRSLQSSMYYIYGIWVTRYIVVSRVEHQFGLQMWKYWIVGPTLGSNHFPARQKRARCTTVLMLVICVLAAEFNWKEYSWEIRRQDMYKTVNRLTQTRTLRVLKMFWCQLIFHYFQSQIKNFV